MKLNKTKINIFLFYFAYLLMLFSALFSKVTIVSNYLDILNDISLVILIVNFFLQRNCYPRKTFVAMVAVFCLAVICSYFAGDRQILRLLLLIYASENIDFNKFMRYTFKITVGMIAIVLICNFLGLTEENIVYREDGSIRSAMGFSHPNTFGYLILLTYFEYIYIHKDKFSKKMLFVILPAIILINYFCDSRTSMIILILLSLFVLFRTHTLEKLFEQRFIKTFITHSFIILTLLTFFCVYLYNSDNEIGLKINELLSGRIYWISNLMDQYGINLFGHNIRLIGQKQAALEGISPVYLDNGYFYILLKYGLCLFLVFALAYKKVIKYFYKNKDYVIILILFLLSIYCLMENIIFNVSFNAFLLVFSVLIFRSKKT